MGENQYGPDDPAATAGNGASHFPLGLVRGLAGGAAGSLIGYFIYQWLVGQGFYSIILPGAGFGLGFGLAARIRSRFYGIFCGLVAGIVGLLSEWSQFPFTADDSLVYFLLHCHQLKPATLIMIGIGAVISYWFGRGRA